METVTTSIAGRTAKTYFRIPSDQLTMAVSSRGVAIGLDLDQVNVDVQRSGSRAIGTSAAVGQEAALPYLERLGVRRGVLLCNLHESALLYTPE